MPPDPAPPDFASAFPSIHRELACPICLSALRLDASNLVCTGCGHIYPVVHGIPILVPGAAQNG